MEKYRKFFHSSCGRIWYGNILTGSSGVVDLCLALDSEQAEIIKNRPKIKAGCCGGFFVKRYNLPGFFNQIRSFFKRSRPEIVLEASQILEKNHIHTPQVIAALSQMAIFRRCDYLVTAKLSAEQQVVPAWLEKVSPETMQHALIQNFIPLLVKMHQAGLSHGDLSLRNIYCDAALENFGILDLDGAKKFSSRRAGKICSAEMARLISSFALYTGGKIDTALWGAEVVKKYNSLAVFQLDEKIVSAQTARFMEQGKKYIAGLV